MSGVSNPADLTATHAAIETNHVLLAVIQATTAGTNADLEIVDEIVDAILEIVQEI